MPEPTIVRGRLIIGDAIVPGVVTIRDGHIASVEPEKASNAGPLIAPGFIDIHVHGWGGHDAMGDSDALAGMSRALLRRGVTSFLPTAVTASTDRLRAFAEGVRTWLPHAPSDGADPLGFNLEGPFLAPSRKGAHAEDLLRHPADVADEIIAELIDGLRIITIAPELPGSIPLISRLARAGVRVSLGHSAAGLDVSRDGYAAGAVSTTHLFNAMSGLTHRDPGLALAALEDDAVWTELIADGHHVDRALWPLIASLKPVSKLILVSDAIPLAGSGDGSGRLGSLEISVEDGRVTLPDGTIAGSVIALDTAVRELVAGGMSLARAVGAASSNPAALLGQDDRGHIAEGRRADLVQLDGDLHIERVMRLGRWAEIDT